MNKYFSTIGEELAKVFQGNNCQPQGTGEIETVKQIKTINFDGRLFKEAVEKLKSGEAHGHDEITTREAKFIGSELAVTQFWALYVEQSEFSENKIPKHLEDWKSKNNSQKWR